MKRAIFRNHGVPQEAIEIIEEPDPIPGPNEVRVRNRIMTINPADLLTIEGRYGAEPVTLPFTPGFGSYGTVDLVGEGVTRLSAGDPVLPVGSGLWSDTIILHERMAPKAPTGIDIEQAAMMRANPGTAYLMLRDFVELSEGDWIIQNASNSSVGRLVIRFAKEFGLRTINIVRREDIVDTLADDGADIVLVDDGNMNIPDALRSVTSSSPKLALDAIGGEASAKLASTLENGGTLIVYGLLSGEDSRIEVRDLVFRDVKVIGFWLSHWYAAAKAEAVREMNNFLLDRLEQGIIHSTIEARYPLSEVKTAVEHAAKKGRSGKIILTGEHDA